MTDTQVLGENKRSRYSVAAGTFYPKSASELMAVVEECLKNGKGASENSELAGKKPKAVIIPHAGYRYSGEIAGAAYNVLAKHQYDEIFLLGVSHKSEVKGVILDENDEWETPLGKVPVSHRRENMAKSDDEAIRDFISADSYPHQYEHSVEVQLPFMQYIWKDKEFYILPGLVGDGSPRLMADALEKHLDQEDLIVVSTDLSHYHSYEEAKTLDLASINAILKLDTEHFEKPEAEACGAKAIALLLEIAKDKGWKPVKLMYKNSGDTVGDKEKVVGYVAVVFVE